MAIIRIYYPCHSKNITHDFLIKTMITPNIKIEDLDKYYECIYSYETEIKKKCINEYLENIFEKFNSEENPLSTPEYQDKIKSLLTHTSMSVGDVVQIDDSYYVVSVIGFKKLY